MNFTPEQIHFIYQVMATILSAVALGLFGLFLKMYKATDEMPRIRKGIRVLFERVEKLEKEIKQKENL